jgi:transposase
VLAWLGRSPAEFGFATERWTAPRVAELIDRSFGVRMNHRYVNAWLAARRVTPQVPDRVPRERDQALVDRWFGREWPRLKKTPGRGTRRSCSPTRAGS